MFRSVTLVNVFDEGIRSRDARLKANSIEAIGELELPDREIESHILPAPERSQQPHPRQNAPS